MRGPIPCRDEPSLFFECAIPIGMKDWDFGFEKPKYPYPGRIDFSNETGQSKIDKHKLKVI
jgi:hypothetical protein